MGDDGGVNIRNVLAGKYTPQQIDTIIKNAKKLPYHEQVELMSLLEAYEKQLKIQGCQAKFLDFVKEMWPAFIAGRHHAIIGEAFERVASGKCKRLIINLPPRHSKSEFTSYLLPAWYLGKHPDRKIIQTAHTAELAVGFGRKVRNLVGSSQYQSVFGGVSLSSDSKAAGRWNTNKGGEYFAIGVGGAVTGKGADCAKFSCKVLIKDGTIPISEVKVGQEVYGFNHKLNRPEWTRVRAVSTQYKPDVIGVGEFLCTPEHLVFTGDGYTRADRTSRAAVLPVWKGIPEAKEGSRAGEEAVSKAGGGQVLLLQSLQGAGEARHCLPVVREGEGTSRSHLPELLSGRRSRQRELRSVWGIVPEESIGIEEGGENEGRGSSFLQFDLLPPVEIFGGTKEARDDGSLPDLRIRLQEGEELLHDLLLQKEGREREGLHKKLAGSEEACEEARWREVRPLPEAEVQGVNPSHQSRFFGPSCGESSPTLHPMPQPVSSSLPGTCAADLKPLLVGSGHWVVDIQTESENFFCEGVLAHNCLIIDDAHSEQQAALALSNPSIYDGVYEWYTSGPRQRLQPGGSIVICMTRWSKRDLCGQILKAAAQRDGVDEWEVIEFPAIMPSGQPLWPEFWSLDELSKIRAELPVSKWSAQYQQNPTSEEGALIKRDWWKIWDRDDPPTCDYIIQSWDTALTKGTRSDYSACTTWGVFYDSDADGKKRTNIILLNAFQDKLEFPELKQKALEEYRYWKPDSCIIEAKAAGAPLVFEMRRMGIPIQDYTPSRGNDKIARVNAVSDIFASGFVYAPPLRWAEEVIEQFASFPNSDHDDLVDSSTQALLRFRQGGFISTQSDEDEEPISRKKADYY